MLLAHLKLAIILCTVPCVISLVDCRSIKNLKKLQRLDVGNNEIESLVNEKYIHVFESAGFCPHFSLRSWEKWSSWWNCGWMTTQSWSYHLYVYMCNVHV